MSLLADLLSKVKHQDTKKEIPPNLKDIVTRQSAIKKKIILISVFSVVAVIAGILIVHLMASFISISDKTKVRSEQLEVKSKSPKSSAQNEVSKKSQESLVYNIEQKTQKDLKGSSPETSLGVESKSKSTRTKISKRDSNSTKGLRTEEIENKTAPQKDAYLYSARDYKIKKDYPGALAYYKKVLEIDKNNFTAMNNIAYILLHLGLANESIKYSQRAVDIKKDYVPALVNLGIAHAKIENIPAAEMYLNRALTIEPDNQSIILNLAVLYERQKDYQRSSEYFSKLTQLGDVTGFLGLARIYEKQDKSEEALKVYKNISSLGLVDIKIQKIVEQKINLLTEKLKK